MADSILSTDDDSVTPVPQPTWLTRQSEVQAAPDTGGFIDGYIDYAKALPAAIRSDNLGYNAVRAMGESMQEYPMDLDYKFDDHRAELTKDLPEEYHVRLAGADSLAEAEARRAKIDKELEDQQYLIDAGASGTAARFAAAIVSPENFIPMAGLMGWASKGSRLVSATKNAAVAGATAGAAEAGLYAMQETRDSDDILYAATFGMVLGGGIGALVADGAGVAAKVATQAADTPVSVPRSEQPTLAAVGPPRPQMVARTVTETPKRRIGPIEVDAEVKAQALIKRFDDLDLTRASQKVRMQFAKDFAEIDHLASMTSKTAKRLDEIYGEVEYNPLAPKTRVERVAEPGSWKELEIDMANATKQMREDMDAAMIQDRTIARNREDAGMSRTDGPYDDAGAAANRSYSEQRAKLEAEQGEVQVLDTSEIQEDIILDANEWVKEEGIKETLKNSWANTA